MLERVSKLIPISVQANLIILSAQLCFSGWHIVGSLVLKSGADPMVFLLYRVAIGTIMMHIYVRVCKFPIKIDPVDQNRFIFVGLLSFGNVLFGILALKFIAPSRFSIFQPGTPCVAAAISMACKLEQFSYVKGVGILLSVAGALLAEMWKEHAASSEKELNVPLGVCLTIMQVSCIGSLMVVVKPLLNKYPPAVVSCVYFTVTSCLIMALCLARIDLIKPASLNFNGNYLPWCAVAYVATFTTMYAFLALSWGGKHLPPTVSSAYFTFQPLGTIILSATLLGVMVTVPEVVGGLLIVAGLTVTSVAQYRADQQRSARKIDSDIELNEIAASCSSTITAPAVYNPLFGESNEGDSQPDEVLNIIHRQEK